MSTSHGFKCQLILDERTAESLGANFSLFEDDDQPSAVSIFKSDNYGQSEKNWVAELYFTCRPSDIELGKLKKSLERATGVKFPELDLQDIPARDWVEESQNHLGPVETGRFFIHGAHIPAPEDQARVSIMIEAGQAFGTGHHASTQGCLAMLEELKKRVTPARILDLGSGSAILAIAVAKLWPACITAIDNDPIATNIGQANALKNGVSVRGFGENMPGIYFITADGIPPKVASKEGPFDLIIANILADPLVALAPVIAKSTSHMGCILISGLLDSQKDIMASAYSDVGLGLLEETVLGEWVTLLFMRETSEKDGMV